MQLDGLALDLRRADHVVGEAGSWTSSFVLDDVDDLVDQQSDGVVVRRDDQHRMRLVGDILHRRGRQQRHQPALMQHDEAAVGLLDAVRLDHLDAREQRQRQHLRQAVAGAEQHQPRVGRRRRGRPCRPRACSRRIFRCRAAAPMPPGSRISTTEPSPRIVSPLKIFRCASEALSGLTTISCTSSTASTLTPKVSAPMRMMTTSCSSAILASAVRLKAENGREVETGTTSSRSFSTSASCTFSITWRESLPRPTASTTACCGRAKR